MLGELRYGFETLVEIHPKLREIEYNAQFLRAHQPGDACVVATLDMKIGAEECVASICLPFNTILPVLSKTEAVVFSPARAGDPGHGAAQPHRRAFLGPDRRRSPIPAHSDAYR